MVNKNSKVAISNKITEKINLYEKATNHISRLIYEGTFPLESRILSIGKLHSQMKERITTVLEDYRLLEDKRINEVSTTIRGSCMYSIPKNNLHT